MRVNLSSLAFWELPEEEQEQAFALLRREAPIAEMPPIEDDLAAIPQVNPTGYRAIVRYDDIKRISRDPQRFSSADGVVLGDVAPELLEATLSFIAMDAPRHTKLRGLVSSAFTPRQVARIEEGIRQAAKEIVADAAPTGGGDFVTLIAKRLPLQTISDMIGVPDADRERIVAAADTIVSVGDEEFLGGREPMAALGEAIFTLSQFASEMAAHREEHPSDDLMTALVQAEIDGERLTHAEISAWFVLLSVAGNDTTRHTTSHAMRALTLHPDQREYIREDPDARLPAAVEEFVRWATPVMHFRRTVREPVELHGETLRPGEKVVMFYLSGNRDDSAIEDPYRFDVTRDPNYHLGFGGGGPHYCLGASLARTQLRSVFGEILAQIPDIEVGEPNPLLGSFIRGVKRMDCSWRPRH
ncbi:MAG: cytochrome P450 [Thermoleophilaceae bacterium]|nr:cytochrome P450 [Thermoleophilaceae bacterium]